MGVYLARGAGGRHGTLGGIGGTVGAYSVSPAVAIATSSALTPSFLIPYSIAPAVAISTSSALTPVFTVPARGTVTASLLTNGGTETNGTSATTASISPGANKLITLAIVTRRDNSPYAYTPTATGNGLTWVQVATTTMNANGQRRLTLLRAMGASPTTGEITIDVNDGNGNHIAFLWSVVEWSGINTSGTNGSGAVVQSDTATSVTTSVTTQTVTLAAFEHANNVNYTAVNLSANNAVTPDDFTELSDAGHATDLMRLADMYKTNDVAAAPSWTTTTAQTIAIEIKSS